MTDEAPQNTGFTQQRSWADWRPLGRSAGTGAVEVEETPRR
jgi:hypothetical protein